MPGLTSQGFSTRNRARLNLEPTWLLTYNKLLAKSANSERSPFSRFTCAKIF